MESLVTPVMGCAVIEKGMKWLLGTPASSIHVEKEICDSFHIERLMIVVTISLLIINQTEFILILNQKENYDHIPFNLKEIINLFLYVYFSQKALCSIYVSRHSIYVNYRTFIFKYCANIFKSYPR